MKIKQVLTLIGLVLINSNVFAAGAEPVGTEPTYCNLETFKKAEIKSPVKNLKRARIFRLGETVLAGMAIGESRATDVITLEKAFSKADYTWYYCSWYLNKGNSEAEKDFAHYYIPHPMSVDPTKAPEIYMSTLESSFAQDDVSFLSCIEQQHYLAMGCNGQMHRGPTVFGMLLAFSGCTPDHAEDIVDDLWGLNGVTRSVRLSIISKAFDLGNAQPEARTRIASALGSR
ncbi:hypothetical protein WDW86_01005 [Bdellovibrionota bacterium FG-2]